MGPWRHGGWGGGPGQKLGKIDFGSPTGEYYRKNIQAPFFAYYLKDKGSLSQPEATVFESGSNKWRTFDSWPPKSAAKKSLYFHAGGKLSFDRADGDRGQRERQLRERPGASGSVSPASHRADVLSRRDRDGTPGCSRISGSCRSGPTC